MAIKAYIAINLTNGGKVKYVNSAVITAQGLKDQWYRYTNGTGDTFEDQTGTAEIKTDFDAILASITGATAITDLITFPEDTNTTTLKRKNTEFHIKSSARVIFSIPVLSVSSVEVIELDDDTFNPA